jgi:hypothetical protein
MSAGPCDCCGRDRGDVSLVRSPSCGETYACGPCRGHEDDGCEAAVVRALSDAEYNRLADERQEGLEELLCAEADRWEP